MKKRFPFIVIFLLGVLLFSCSENKNETNSLPTLPPSAGAIGDVLLVVDTNHLKTELGAALEEVFLEPYVGLPQAETNYKLNRIHFPAFSSLFKKAKTVIFAIPFNEGMSKGHIQRMIGDEATAKIQTSKKTFLVKKDVFASDQQIIFIFGENVKELAKNISNNAQAITRIIDEKEIERTVKELYKVGERKKLAQKLKK